MTISAPTFNAVHFCESLYTGAQNAAKKRLGQLPITQQIQMIDAIAAFKDLRQTDYTEHFGLTVGEWNETSAIITTFLTASNPKAQHTLHPDIGLVFVSIIEAWKRFSDLPEETKNQILKAKQIFLKNEDKFLDRLKHFFNEMKVRATSLSAQEKDGIMALIALYLPQTTAACHKRDPATILNLLGQLEADLTRLSTQQKEPSRQLTMLITKTHHDIGEFETFGNKGKKPRK
jgi:hypothetical protein